MPAYLEAGPAQAQPVRDHRPGRRRRAGARSAPQRGRKTKPGLKLGVCGEHGGDPESIAFFYEAGLDYVSCSPFRVPIARLAAAQAVLGAGARHPLSRVRSWSMITPPAAADSDRQLRGHRRRTLAMWVAALRAHHRAAARRPAASSTARPTPSRTKEAAIESARLDRHRPRLRPGRAVGLRRPGGGRVLRRLPDREEPQSVDNVFVWAVIFSFFAVPREVPVPGAVLGHLRRPRPARRLHLRRRRADRALRLGALRLRRLPRSSPASGSRATTRTRSTPSSNPVLRLVRGWCPSTTEYDGQKLFTRRRRQASAGHAAVRRAGAHRDHRRDLRRRLGARHPGREPRAVHRVRARTPSPSSGCGRSTSCWPTCTPVPLPASRPRVILVFVGIKMIISHWYHIPTPLSLGFIALVLVVSIVASIRRDDGGGDGVGVAVPQPEHVPPDHA